MKRSLRRRIEQIPGEEGWWKTTSKEAFFDLADDLKRYGCCEDDVVAILTTAYLAVVDEVGG